MEKTCTRCEVVKTTDDYYSRRTICKECVKKVTQRARDKRKKAIKESPQDTEKTCARCEVVKTIKDFPMLRSICKDCVKMVRQKYQDGNREQINEYSKNYRRDNEEARKWSVEYAKKWNKKNRKRISTRENERRRTEPQFKLKKILRDNIYKAVKREWKSGRTLDILGCSIKMFKFWLEHQWSPEMTWENHGSHWEIDHIKPIASYDLTNVEEMKKCFHWTNMQPLTKEENGFKNDKIIPELILEKEKLAVTFKTKFSDKF
jgi:hypothetical protein